MKEKKTLSKVIATMLLGVAVLLFNTHTTEASEKDVDPVLEEKLKIQVQRFMEMGIDKETAEKLTEKVARGELLDAQKESEVKKIDEEDLNVDLEEGEKFIEFDDGSRINMSLEENKEEPKEPVFSTLDYSTGTVKTNSCTTGSGYKNCSVTAQYYDGVWNLKFNAKISMVSGGYDSISSISRPVADVNLYNVDQKKFAITRKKETSSAAAKADYTNQFTLYTGLYSISRTLSLYVKNDKPFARLNFY